MYTYLSVRSDPDSGKRILAIVPKGIPDSFRPPKFLLDRFVKFFPTFLETSFAYHRLRKRVGDGPTSHFDCFCEVCIEHLRKTCFSTKKLYKKDKSRAVWLMVLCLKEIADSAQIELSLTQAETLTELFRKRRTANTLFLDLAICTYSQWLVNRTEGITDGPAVFGIWRIISRKEDGGFRKKEPLNYIAVTGSFNRIVEYLNG